MKKILLFDRDLLEARPLSRFRSIFSVRDGIFSTLERVRRAHPDAELYYCHAHEREYELTIAGREELRSLRAANPDLKIDRAVLEREFDAVLDSRDLSPFDMLGRVGQRIDEDLALVDFESAPVPVGVSVVPAAAGTPHQLLLHPDAVVLPGSVLDLRAGSIMIGAGTEITPFCYLAGPLVVSAGCRVDDARIGNSILGEQVRAGGEIENSIFGDFTNKHHEGFVGHSVLGRWVNLGALTTTSDLKNNYGPVRLEIPAEFYPGQNAKRQMIDSGTIKFGSILGDCVKTAIGTMLNTGTVVDVGCNVFGGSPGKYMPPLSWGTNGDRYDPERFLADSKKIFARRNRTPEDAMRVQVERIVAGLRAKGRKGRLPLGPGRDR